MAFERIACWILLGVGLTGCSLAGGPSGPGPPGRPMSEGTRVRPTLSGEGESSASGRESDGTYLDRSGEEIALAVVETAFQAIGSPYEWGGTDANGFDCSGLIQYSYGKYGIQLSRISRDQLRQGRPVGLRVESLRPGDILGFSAVVGGVATHVGLYVGDGQFIHSSSSGVRVSDIREPYWQQHFIAARRMVR